MSAEGTAMIYQEALKEQRDTIIFLAKLLAKAHHERDHARDVAVAAEVEVARLKAQLEASA